MFRCKHLKTGKYYACKVFKTKFNNKKKALENREIKILQRFDSHIMNKGVHCPFVMKAEKIEFIDRTLYVFFELMEMSLT